MINFYGHENGILTFIMSPTLHRVYLEWTREILGKFNSYPEFSPHPILVILKTEGSLLYRLHSSWIQILIASWSAFLRVAQSRTLQGVHRLTLFYF